MNNEQEIVQLKDQVKLLLEWKSQREKQQLTYPLDKISTDIIQKDIFIAKDFVVYTRTNGVVTPFAVVGSINGKPTTLSALEQLKPVTANAATDVLTSANHGFVD